MFQINKKLLPVKIHYFLLNGAHSGVIPLVPVYAKQLGISASTVGIIFAVISCLTVVSRTLFGVIVDHFQRLKTVLIILIVIDIAADMGLNFIPNNKYKAEELRNVNISCHGGTSYLIRFHEFRCQNESKFNIDCFTCTECQSKSKYCSTNQTHHLENETFVEEGSFEKDIYENCTIDNNTMREEACYINNECAVNSETNYTLQVLLLSLFIGIIYIANGSIVSLSDAACYNALNNHPENFGRQRMFGTIGWGLFALLAGYLNQLFTGTSKDYNFSPGFYLLAILFFFDLPAIGKLKLQNSKAPKNICKDISRLILKPDILLLIIGIFFIGVATGISRSYLFWYYRTTLNANQLVLGLSSGIQCFLGELPFFFFSGKIINKIGHINVFTMSFIAYGMRFLIQSYLYNPWIALITDLLQGPCFGSFYSAMTSYAKIIAPKGTDATVHGLLSGTFEGIGVAAGNLLGGFATSVYGGRETFFWAGIVSFIIGILHIVVYAVFDCKVTETKNTTQEEQQHKVPLERIF